MVLGPAPLLTSGLAPKPYLLSFRISRNPEHSLKGHDQSN